MDGFPLECREGTAKRGPFPAFQYARGSRRCVLRAGAWRALGDWLTAPPLEPLHRARGADTPPGAVRPLMRRSLTLAAAHRYIRPLPAKVAA